VPRMAIGVSCAASGGRADRTGRLSPSWAIVGRWLPGASDAIEFPGGNEPSVADPDARDRPGRGEGGERDVPRGHGARPRASAPLVRSLGGGHRLRGDQSAVPAAPERPAHGGSQQPAAGQSAHAVGGEAEYFRRLGHGELGVGRPSAGSASCRPREVRFLQSRPSRTACATRSSGSNGNSAVRPAAAPPSSDEVWLEPVEMRPWDSACPRQPTTETTSLDRTMGIATIRHDRL
jgi:hypothetical protein